jgi:ribosome-associated protein
LKMAPKRGRLPSRRKSEQSAKATGSKAAFAPGEVSGLDMARRCARAALEKKAEDVLLLDLRGIATVCDFFVLASGTSEPHVQALAQGVQECMEEDFDMRPWHVEGATGRRWILLDYVDWVVHIFHRETREFYELERLWSDAPQERFEQ